MTLDLTDAWAKLDRAKRHVDDLRAGITKVAYTKDLNAIPIPLRRQYEVDLGAVVYRISSVIHISDDWPLLAGDAIENFRAALDYLMWQLAVLKLGRQPTQKEASAVQF